MAKSKAQRMREYRERKKAKLGQLWLKAETDRVKGYYVPTSELNANSQRKRRVINKENQFKFRNKRRTQNNVEPTQEPENDNTISSTSDTTLTVKLPFKNSNTKSSSGKKRISRALSRSYKRIVTLEDRNEDLQRKLKNAQRILQRYEAKKQGNTPKSKTDSLLKMSGLKPTAVPEIRKKLIFGEFLTEEIKAAKHAQDKQSEKKKKYS